MNKTFNLKQYTTLIIIFAFGSFILTHGSKIAKQDTWLVILFGFLIALPQIFVVAYINTKNPQKNIFDIFKIYFGKFLGTIFSIYFIISFIILAIFVCRIFMEYLRLTGLQSTPLFFLSALIIIPCVYTASQNVQIITRISSFLFIIFMIMFAIVSIFSLTIIKDIENMMPIFHLTVNETLKYSIESYMNPYYEIYVFLVFGAYLKKGQSQYKALFISFLLIALLLSFNSLRNILVLGTPAYYSIYFPSYITNTVLSSGTMMERIELLFSFFFAFCMYIKLIVLIKAASIGIKSHLSRNIDLYIISSVGLIILLSSSFYFKNLEHYTEVMYGNFRLYMNFGILFIIILTFILTYFKTRYRNKQLIRN